MWPNHGKQEELPVRLDNSVEIWAKINSCQKLNDTRAIAKLIDTYESSFGRNDNVREMRNKLCDISFDLFAKEFPKTSRESSAPAKSSKKKKNP